MENPRPEKVAVVDEVRSKLSDAQATLLTEYRGLTVTDLQTLRRTLREAGGEVKIYKNTLVRFAARDLGLDLDDLLTGPTAIAFVSADGGDPVTVAKALKDFAKTNPALVMKGGVLGDKLLSADDAKALADVESREVILAKLAGAMAAPMQQFAGLLQALPRNFAYGLSALIEQGGAGDAADAAPEPDPEPSASVETEAPAAADETEAATSTDEPSADVAAETPNDTAAAADEAAESTEES